MLPVTDHTARATHQIAAAMKMATGLGPCDVNASGRGLWPSSGRPRGLFQRFEASLAA